MRLEGENISLGLKLSSPVSVNPMDWYFTYSYPGIESKTISGLLIEHSRETIIWEKSSYNQVEVIEYFNLFNNDTTTNNITVYVGSKIIGTWELKTGERLEYINGRGWTVKNIEGLEKIASESDSCDCILQYDHLSNFPAIGDLHTMYIAKDSNIMYFWNGTSYVNTPNPNESVVKIVRRNTVAAFTKPHGTLRMGNRLYIGTRNTLEVVGQYSRLVYYPDYHDFTSYSYIDMPISTLPFQNNVESVCYDTITDKIIAPLSKSKKLVVANPNNITSYSIINIVTSSNFAASTPILTDNVGNVYLTSGAGTDCNIIKINTTSWAVTELVWTGVESAHAGYIFIDANKLCLISNGANPRLAVIDLASFSSYTELALDLANVTTDDCLMFPSDPFGLSDNGFINLYNVLVVLGEGRNFGKVDEGALVIDIDNMIQYSIGTVPGVAITFNPATLKIIIGGLGGLIETFDVSDIINAVGEVEILRSLDYTTDVYIMRGFVPNEIFVTPDMLLTTSFDSQDGGGNLMQIELVGVDNPSLSTIEANARYSNRNTSDGSVDWTDVTVTNANFTAVNDTRYYLPASVLTVNRTVDMSAITTKVRFVIEEDRYILAYTGAPVYGWGGSEVRDALDGRLTTTIEKIGSKLIIVS